MPLILGLTEPLFLLLIVKTGKLDNMWPFKTKKEQDQPKDVEFKKRVKYTKQQFDVWKEDPSKYPDWNKKWKATTSKK
jgi:hypothetical protein